MTPKITDWDYRKDHGIVRLHALEDVARMIPMVAQVVYDEEDGAKYSFKALEEHNLPQFVHLTIQLPAKRMLATTDPEDLMERVLGYMCEDNNWPKEDDGTYAVYLNSADWQPHLEHGQPAPSGKGYWLIRFRASPAVADVIRKPKDEGGQFGDVFVNTELLPVYHNGEVWRGNREATLIADFEPTAEMELEASADQPTQVAGAAAALGPQE